ncbi:ATP-binding cassette domain-containing protein [Jannaschia marina]|uniref:ATP-binding cassette domain-containing protein n=1 Tax=Jannaschia marina TaxID=2741674 RepID=UPI0015C6D073|nr:ATP-binding cassette domain-containing protein [Jannaschia marina]
MEAALACEGLTVTYAGGATPVRGIDLVVAPGICLALLGGSGAGKSTVARALLGLHGRGTRVTGRLTLGGREMTGAGPAAWRAARGRQIGFVAQNPWSGTDPLRVVQDHVAEAWRCHGLAVSWDEIAARLDAIGVPEARDRMAQRPHAPARLDHRRRGSRPARADRRRTDQRSRRGPRAIRPQRLAWTRGGGCAD